MASEERAEERRDDYELCECGDFRINHENGTGRCRFTTHGIPDPKLNRCVEFRGTGRYEQPKETKHDGA